MFGIMLIIVGNRFNSLKIYLVLHPAHSGYHIQQMVFLNEAYVCTDEEEQNIPGSYHECHVGVELL